MLQCAVLREGSELPIILGQLKSFSPDFELVKQEG
jgi:hypothetical protein